MAYRLGVDLGTSFTAAAVLREGSAPEIFALGDKSLAVPSVLFINMDGSVLYGHAAERRAPTDPERVVRHFKGRIGDEVPLVLGTDSGDSVEFYAHDLAAALIAWVVARVAEHEGEAPAAIGLSHPAAWGLHKKDLLIGALEAHGIDNLRLISEPEAAAVSHARAGLLEPGTTLAVYDLGASTFDVTLLRATSNGRFALVGRPHRLPDLGGVDFDDAILTHVLRSLTDIFEADSDPDLSVTATPEVAARLRADVVAAKETLSSETAAFVPAWFIDNGTTIRITRADFDELVTPLLAQTLDVLDRALADNGVASHDLSWVLLTGGSARIPLVSEMLCSHLESTVNVVRHVDPALTVATGAALALSLPAGPSAEVIDRSARSERGNLNTSDSAAHVRKNPVLGRRAAIVETGAAPAGAYAAVPLPLPSPGTVDCSARSEANFLNRAAEEPPRPAKDISYVTDLEQVKKPRRAEEPEPGQRPGPSELSGPATATFPAGLAASAAAELAKAAFRRLPAKLIRNTAASGPGPAALEAVPTPVISGEPGTGRPFLHRRTSNRAWAVTLWPEVGAPQGSDAGVPASDGKEAAPITSLSAPLAVVPPRAVAPVSDLLRTELTDRITSAGQPPAKQVGPALPANSIPPDGAYLIEKFEAEDKRGKADRITLRRVLAVTTLTTAIFAGSGAWVAAIAPTVAVATHPNVKNK